MSVAFLCMVGFVEQGTLGVCTRCVWRELGNGKFKVQSGAVIMERPCHKSSERSLCQQSVGHEEELQNIAGEELEVLCRSCDKHKSLVFW